MNSTPPSGSLLLSHLVDKLSDDPREQLIKDQALTIKLYQQKVTELSQMPNTKPSPVPVPPLTFRTMTKRQLAKASGKWTTVLVVLGIVLPIAAKKWPAYADIIEYVRSLLP